MEEIRKIAGESKRCMEEVLKVSRSFNEYVAQYHVDQEVNKTTIETSVTSKRLESAGLNGIASRQLATFSHK